MDLFKFTCILGLLIPYSIALQVTPNSPCASFCIDSDGDDVSDPNSSTTMNKDITCYDSKYSSSPTGLKFQRCISCLQDSTFSQGSENDQLWFLYNLRYTFDNCIFGFPHAKGLSTPCSTSTACGALEAALTGDDLSPSHLDYSYCDVDGGVMTGPSITKCVSCVGASEDQSYLANYLVALEAGCNQRPSAGITVGLNDTVFSSTIISAIDTASKTSKDNKPALPTTSIVGIAVGAAVIILAVAGFFFVRYRKRRNQRLRLEGDTSIGGSSRRGHHRPASSLSFRCQTHLTPRSPAFFPSHSDATIEEEKGYSNPNLALGSHPAAPGSPTSRTSQTSWQPQPSYSTIPSFSRPGSTQRPLRNISITTPTVPENVHYSTSPKASRFSPLEETPISTTSTKSTAQLLPLRPYNPAEYGVSSPHLGSSADGSYTSPTSGTTASPLLSRLWEQNQKQNQDSMSPIWEMPQREITAARPKAAAALERIGVPPSPGKKRVSKSGSPIESKQINMSFPGPPSPGARWGRT
ncbi:hypothetical protein HD806DRAFT_536869 [Xylariaceae sp. AK1471]|nr:hypothetical protein HD806DRAFT_536869 [Xylariaceae sp. AK1471]